jgi:hypothetical protein
MKLARVEVYAFKLAIPLAVVCGSKVSGQIDKRSPGNLWLSGAAGTVEMAHGQR